MKNILILVYFQVTVVCTVLSISGRQMSFVVERTSQSGEAFGFWKIPYQSNVSRSFEVKVYECSCANNDLFSDIEMVVKTASQVTYCKAKLTQDSSNLEGVYYAVCSSLWVLNDAYIIISLKNNHPMPQFSISSVSITTGLHVVEHRVLRFPPKLFLQVPPRTILNIKTILTSTQLSLFFQFPVQVVKVVLPSSAQTVNGVFVLKTYTAVELDCVLAIKSITAPKDGLVLWGLRPIRKIIILAKLPPQDKIIIVYHVNGVLYQDVVILRVPTTTPFPTTTRSYTTTTRPTFSTTTYPGQQRTCVYPLPTTTSQPSSPSFSLLTITYHNINALVINSHRLLHVTKLDVVKTGGVIGSNFFNVFLYKHTFDQYRLTTLLQNYASNYQSVTGSSCSLSSAESLRSTYECHDVSQIASVLVLFDLDAYFKEHVSESTSNHTTTFVLTLFDARHSTLVSVEYKIKHTQAIIMNDNQNTYGHTTKSESIFRPTTSNYIHVDEGTYPQYLDGEGSSGDLSNYEQDGAGGSYDTYQHDSKSDGRVIFA